jgi:hypothetical protein
MLRPITSALTPIWRSGETLTGRSEHRGPITDLTVFRLPNNKRRLGFHCRSRTADVLAAQLTFASGNHALIVLDLSTVARNAILLRRTVSAMRARCANSGSTWQRLPRTASSPDGAHLRASEERAASGNDHARAAGSGMTQQLRASTFQGHRRNERAGLGSLFGDGRRLRRRRRAPLEARDERARNASLYPRRRRCPAVSVRAE